MYPRVTLLELDPVRVSARDAVAMFEAEVLPTLRAQDGYEGAYVLTTPEGRALLMTLWESEEAATKSSAQAFYSEQLERYMTLFRAPPGRERYEVALADIPAVAVR
jgi:heme-degrading monooxygenase HmoA